MASTTLQGSPATSDGNGLVATLSGPSTVYVSGTFGGAKVRVEVSSDNSVFVTADSTAVPNSEFFAPGATTINAIGTNYVRAVLSGATATTSITAVAVQ